MPGDLIFDVNYLGGNLPTFALNFSRPGGQVICQYFNFLRLGREGFRKVHDACYETAAWLADEIAKLGPFDLLYNGRGGIPGVTWTLKPDSGLAGSLYDLADRLRTRGWLVPAYSMPPNCQDIVVQRILVRHGFSRDLATLLLDDLKRSIDHFRAHPVSEPMTRAGSRRVQPLGRTPQFAARKDGRRRGRLGNPRGRSDTQTALKIPFAPSLRPIHRFKTIGRSGKRSRFRLSAKFRNLCVIRGAPDRRGGQEDFGDILTAMTAEHVRLKQSRDRTANWQRWGPYLAERQWGTVREDYSATGECWTYFPHDHARSRAYRWGEDGLLGICDRECRLCFALALWNGKDPILKERLFGLTGPEGNHGEDVKEFYFYLDSSPTHSYLKALYKYPQAAFPYESLVAENRRRGRAIPSSSWPTRASSKATGTSTSSRSTPRRTPTTS